jgi:RNA recognition motif-containing protein
MERKKGKSRGYGFVDMPNEEEKNAAIAALEGKEFMWRVLSVSPVVPKVKRNPAERRSTFKKADASKSHRREDRTSKPESTSESASKYYSKFDGPPKPWRKVNADSKPVRKSGQGSRPYYGKSDRNPTALDKKEEGSRPYGRSNASRPAAKPSKGFKMFHKVSGASKTTKTRPSIDIPQR